IAASPRTSETRGRYHLTPYFLRAFSCPRLFSNPAMTLNEARVLHAQLVEEIRQHDHSYYVLAQPTISDQEYDRLYRRLVDLEKEFPDLATPNSPSQRVAGQPVGGFERVKHIVPMLSLEKIKASD